MKLGWIASLALAALLWSGCAGYKLGPSNGERAGARSVQVSPFANSTLVPRVGDSVTTALRKRFQKDGTFRLATHDAGDVIVTGTILKYERSGLSYSATDVLTVQDARISVVAHVTARDRGTDKVLLDREVTGYTIVRAGADLSSAERQALPLLADDLAKNVTALLVDGTW
jgi:hypothetical protein